MALSEVEQIAQQAESPVEQREVVWGPASSEQATVTYLGNPTNMQRFQGMLSQRVFTHCEQVTEDLVATLMDAYRPYSHALEPINGCEAALQARRLHGIAYQSIMRRKTDITQRQRDDADFDPVLRAEIEAKDAALAAEKQAALSVVYEDIGSTMTRMLVERRDSLERARKQVALEMEREYKL